MGRYAVVTTFNQAGLDTYAQRFIDTFDQNMPYEIDLYLYAENCDPEVPKSSQRTIKIIPVEKTLDKLVRFKEKYQYDRRLIDLEHLQELIPEKSHPEMSVLYRFLRQLFHNSKFILTGKKIKKKRYSIELNPSNIFRWDPVRFSHKVYAVIDASRRVKSDVLIWMDADSIVHSKMPMKFLDDLIDEQYFTHYLGRKNNYSECGWYSMNLCHQHAGIFFNEFERMYEHAEDGIFQLKEWHDSYVWDSVRLWHESKYGVRNKSISGAGYFTSHPLVNSCLGQYFDHLKGNRKSGNRSRLKDLKVTRDEPHWQSI